MPQKAIADFIHNDEKRPRANARGRCVSQHFNALDGEHETHCDDEDGARFEDVFVIFSGQRIAEQAEPEHANASTEAEHEHQRRTLDGRACRGGEKPH